MTNYEEIAKSHYENLMTALKLKKSRMQYMAGEIKGWDSLSKAERQCWVDQVESLYKAAFLQAKTESIDACNAISWDRFALYKGLSPYTGKEPERADNYIEGQSDGAELCATGIADRVTPYDRQGDDNND